MMSPEEVKLLSGDRIIRHDDVYEAPRQSKTAMPEIPPPIHGGVADLRLGTFSADPCYTCGHSNAPNSPNTNTMPRTLWQNTISYPVPNYLYIDRRRRQLSSCLRTLKYVCMKL